MCAKFVLSMSASPSKDIQVTLFGEFKIVNVSMSGYPSSCVNLFILIFLLLVQWIYFVLIYNCVELSFGHMAICCLTLW